LKPPRFHYADPDSVEGALACLAEHGEDAKVLAGGQSLMPLLNMRLARPEWLVDINGIAELGGVHANGALAVGALTRHHDAARSEIVRERCPLLAEALPLVGHAAIRYRGTIGGSLAHADPAAELPAVAVALDAEMVLRGQAGERTVPAAQFYRSFLETAIEPTELLAAVRFPGRPARAGSAVLELARRHGDFALAGVAVEVVAEDGLSARACAFGVDQVPVRLTAVEELLAGEAPTGELLAQAGELAARSVDPASDMHASAGYRRRMTGVLARRALERALANAGAEGA
jgi:carbon-monoxide dehydrogenase medium subunit